MNASLTESGGGTRVSPHRLWTFGILLFFLGFAVLGVLLFISSMRDLHNPKLVEAMWSLVVATVFFWFSWQAFLRLSSGYGTYIGPQGVTIPGPTFKPKLIAWSDIEAISSFRVQNSSFTGVRLKTYARLISQYSPEEIRILLRRNRWLGRANRLAAPVAIGPTGINQAIAATGDVADLAAYFSNRRQAYGCDVLFTAVDRDRSADDFATYLNEFREKYAQTSLEADTFNA